MAAGVSFWASFLFGARHWEAELPNARQWFAVWTVQLGIKNPDEVVFSRLNFKNLPPWCPEAGAANEKSLIALGVLFILRNFEGFLHFLGLPSPFGSVQNLGAPAM